MDKVTISVEFLSSVLGTDVGSFPQEEAQIEGFLKGEIVKKLDAAKRTGKDEAFGRAKRETAEELEKKIAEKLGVEKSDLDKMVDAYMEKNKASFKADPKDIRNSDVYIEDMKSEKQKYVELEKLKNDELTKIQKQSITEKLKTKAIELITEGGYVLPEDRVKRENQIDLFISNILNSNDFKPLEDGKKFQVLDKDGNPVRNDVHAELDFDTFFTGKANSYFDVSKTDGRKAPENKTDQNGKVLTVPDFNSSEEYVQKLYATKDPEVRAALAKSYDERLKKGDITD
jgi:DNA-binding MarR family transcriptional regulator